jgi:hypothetical protein
MQSSALVAADTCGPGVSYPRWMPDIPQLVAAIDGRLAAIAAEVTALDAAKAQLAAPRAGGQVPAVTTDATATRSRSRTPRGRLPLPPHPPEPATGRRAAEPVKATQDGRSLVTARRSTRTRPSSVTRSRRGGGAVGAEALERLLADTSAGLSANAIAKRAGAGYARTLKLLHQLEAAGHVRRLGVRRSTIWRLITDEERIASALPSSSACAAAPASGADGPGPRSVARHDAVGFA